MGSDDASPVHRGGREADKGTTPEFDFQTCIPDFPNLTPLAPLSARGEGGTLVPRAACSPSPFTERGLGGEVVKAEKNTTPAPEVEAEPCTLIRGREGGERTAGKRDDFIFEALTKRRIRFRASSARTPTPDVCHFAEKAQYIEACCFTDAQYVAQNAQSDKLQSSTRTPTLRAQLRSVGVLADDSCYLNSQSV